MHTTDKATLTTHSPLSKIGILRKKECFRACAMFEVVLTSFQVTAPFTSFDALPPRLDVTVLQQSGTLRNIGVLIVFYPDYTAYVFTID